MNISQNKDNSPLEDSGHMYRCFELAQRAKGHTAPNPMVGAVLVYNDQVIGEGWHHYYGADHAEVNCLKNVNESSKHLIRESTMYVNLEPCAHHGITPPCADRLVKEGIRKVVMANTDPFEKVSGKGINILKNAGVAVESGILQKEGLWVNRRFFCFHTKKRPYIILKWAQTKEGFIAPADRSRLQITGAESNQLVHRWRTEESAIMVGTTTAIMDNPQLTARHWEGKHPLRIVLDRNLQIPNTHHLFDNTAATWIINEQQELIDGNVHSIQLHFDDTLLSRLMNKLYEAKILSIIVDGGATLLNSFINMGLWDEARVLTGTVALSQGLNAPILADNVHAINSSVGDNSLDVFINKTSAFPYVKGMEL